MDHPAVEWPAAFADQMIREGEESDSEELTEVRWGSSVLLVHAYRVPISTVRTACKLDVSQDIGSRNLVEPNSVIM